MPFRALLLVVIVVAKCDAFLSYYPMLAAPQYGPRVFSPYPVLTSLVNTREDQAVTPNPLLDRAIYQGRRHWDCNELELLINKAELSITTIRDHVSDNVITRSVFANDKFVKLMQDVTRQRKIFEK